MILASCGFAPRLFCFLAIGTPFENKCDYIQIYCCISHAICCIICRMDKKEYENLKWQVEEKYKTDVQSAEKQRHEALIAIDMVRNMIRENQAIDTMTKAIIETQKTYGSLAAAVRDALEEVPNRFTKDDILRAIRNSDPVLAENLRQSSLSGTLIHLVAKNVIKKHRKGKGSSPTIYMKMAR